MSRHAEGVSFVIPVHNGAEWLDVVLKSVLAQADGRPMEVLVVEDGSTDRSLAVLATYAAAGAIRVIDGPRRGATAALNEGIRHAQYPIICQVDQDVILEPGWMARLTDALRVPSIGAAQGYYMTPPDGGPWARVMGLDLENRYRRIVNADVDHVCTGNTAYRADALRKVGLFDETLGYGYDNDMSYRLAAAGYRLVIREEARSIHRWREGWRSFLVQQYGFGYGRLDLVAKHRGRRVRGDDVSGLLMMLHAPLMGLALAAALLAALLATAGVDARALLLLAAGILGGLAGERLVAGIRAAVIFRDAAGLLFVPMHLARDLAWVAAIVFWSARRVQGVRSRPEDSMHPRPALPSFASLGFPGMAIGRRANRDTASGSPPRVLVVVPAFNEAGSLTSVVAELRRHLPDAGILVVDDGSTDGTRQVLADLDVDWLRMPMQLGVGAAVRAGLRYACQAGYNIAVRVDGDGQHPAAVITRLLEPVLRGDADAATGSRYLSEIRSARTLRRGVRYLLGRILTVWTRQEVTDPTSGLWVFGPRALQVLRDHHPSGYPEPELLLFLSRNRIGVAEVQIRMRDRLAGQTSLTPQRMSAALARLLLLLVVVPLRSTVGSVR